MSGINKFLKSFASGDTSFRKTSMTDEVGKLVVDTTNTPDMGWETGIKKNGEWIIVEEYKTQEQAKKGHKKWVMRVKKHPTMKLKSCRTIEDWLK
jgi:hypothetical protein